MFLISSFIDIARCFIILRSSQQIRKRRNPSWFFTAIQWRQTHFTEISFNCGISFHVVHTFRTITYSKLPDEELLSNIYFSPDTIKKLHTNLLPIINYSTDFPEKEKNEKFIQALALHRKLLDDSNYSFDYVVTHLDEAEKIIVLYKHAANEGSTEASANYLWWILFFGIVLSSLTDKGLKNVAQIIDPKTTAIQTLKLGFLQNAQHRKDISNSPMYKLTQQYIIDFEEDIIQHLNELATEGYVGLATYYNSLRYVYGIIYNDLTPEMNHTIGQEMMRSFALM